MDKHLTHSINNLLPLHQSENHHQAFIGYQELLLQYPNEPQLHHLIGIYHAQTNQPQKAQKSVEKAITLDPKEPSYQVSLANIFKAQGKLAQSKSLLEKLIREYPDFISAKINLASNYIKMDQHHLAKPLLEELISDGHQIANIFYLNALTDIHAGSIESGIELLEKAHQLEPDHLPTIKQLAKSYHQNNQHIEAKPLYEFAVTRYPNDAEFKQCAAINLLALEEDDAALIWLVEVLAMAPNLEHINHNLASIYLNKGMFREALHHFMRELESEESIDILYNIGVTYQYLGRLEDAKTFFTRVLEHDGKHLGALINLGANALQNYNSQEAISYYQSALKIKPGDLSIIHVLKALQGQQESDSAPEVYIKNLFDQYAGHYDSHLLKMLNYQVPKHIPRLINEYGPQSKGTIIDCGCGTGLMGEWLKPFANELIGIDLSEKMTREAKKKNIYDALYVQDIMTFDKTDANIIIGADILPYIGDCSAFLKWCMTRLHHGGIVCFSFEKNNYNKTFYLQKSARFCHHEEYIQNLAMELGFQIPLVEPLMLRKQLGEPLEGFLMVLCK